MKNNTALILVTLATLLSGGIASAAAEAKGLSKPEAVTIVEPEVPYNFTRWGVTGEVEVSFSIDREGRTEDIVIESASNPVYAESVKRAVAQWTFEKPEVPGVRYHVPVVFN